MAGEICAEPSWCLSASPRSAEKGRATDSVCLREQTSSRSSRSKVYWSAQRNEPHMNSVHLIAAATLRLTAVSAVTCLAVWARKVGAVMDSAPSSTSPSQNNGTATEQ